MPPVPVNHEIGPVEQLPLTDQDVELLHQIVTRAEDHPDAAELPFRAVFSAYDDVLSEHGIDAGKDRTFLRFLFLLGDSNVHGEGLYAKFENLLAQLGIQLEYSDGDEDDASAAPGTDRDGDSRHARNHALLRRANGITQQQDRPRRASFNSVYDLSTEVTQRSVNRPSSRLSESRLDGVEPSDNPIHENTLFQAATKHPQALRELARSLLASGGKSGNQFRLAQNNGAYPNARSSGEFAYEPQQPKYGQGHNQDGHHDPQEAANDEDVEDVSGGSSSEADVTEEHLAPSEIFYQPSFTHLLRDASVFNMHRQRNASRKLLRLWLEQAMRRQHDHQAMDQVAVRHDQAALSHQAFDMWLVRLQQKRHEAQTERFFRHLEERAGRARDLYLLTKVFSHWGQVTSDEIQRTSAARHHILCVKYFNAWREVTAINELKAQRFTLKKPFKLWVGRLRKLRNDQEKSAEFYNRSMCRQFYWSLFWHFSYQLMPQWRDYRLKSRYLVSWLRKFRGLRDWEQEIDAGRQRGLLRSAFQPWYQRSRTVAFAEDRADAQLTAKLMKDNFAEWRIQRRLRSNASQVSNLVRLRIIRSSFCTWASRTSCEVQARETDRARIMRNAWTVWNDRLRHQSLSRRIGERVVMEALYKWVLMERFRLMTRIHQQRMKREMLAKLMMNSRGLYTHLLHCEEEFKTRRKRELVRQKFSLWRRHRELQRQRDRMATEFYAPRVEQETWNLWKSRTSHLNKMASWAKDARFYFLTMMTIKRWHAATVDSSKRRKETAYATIRRKVKVNLVTAALSSWRSQMARVVELEHRSDQMRLRSLSRRATDIFDLWATETSRRVGHITDSDTYYSRQLVYNNLVRWIRAFRTHQTQEENATQFLEIHISRFAAAQLRKFSLRLFQMTTSFETADAQNDRNTRKHFKNMLRHWASRARAARSSAAAQTPTTPAAPGNGYSLNALDEEEEWQDADGMLHVNELLSQANSTPRTPVSTTPGYLNSPSRRAARAKSLAHLSTTPATPLRTPFAGRLLSQGTATEPRGSSTKKSFVPKSGLGPTVRFAVGEEDKEDEEPESPTTGRGSYRDPS